MPSQLFGGKLPNKPQLLLSPSATQYRTYCWCQINNSPWQVNSARVWLACRLAGTQVRLGHRLDWDRAWEGTMHQSSGLRCQCRTRVLFKWEVLNNLQFRETLWEVSIKSPPCRVRLGSSKVNKIHHPKYLQWYGRQKTGSYTGWVNWAMAVLKCQMRMWLPNDIRVAYFWGMFHCMYLKKQSILSLLSLCHLPRISNLW